MIQCSALSIIDDIAIGPLHFYTRPARRYDLTPCTDPQAELARMESARQMAIQQQEVFYEKALAEAGADIAVVFQVHALMLDDHEFVDAARKNITEHQMRAEYAVRCAAYAMVDRFAEVDDEYLRARIDDILDMARCVIYLLQGDDLEDRCAEPSIIIAEDLSPSETVRLDKSKLLGFVTKQGSIISHTAILARSMSLPALVGCREISPDWEGRTAILDGLEGQLILDPDEETLALYRKMQKEVAHRKKLLRLLKGKPNTTEDGRTVTVAVSISQMKDLELVKETDAQGIGHFRTEYLFMNEDGAPDENTQCGCYKQMLRASAPHPVYISLCDMSSDKKVKYLHFRRENNPALGVRGVRWLLQNKALCKTQLRAALRAATAGPLNLMVPMVTRTEEMLQMRALLEECRRELETEGTACGAVALGPIVETPSAIFLADELAEVSDFFSIGSNDLTQYICVADRTNPDLLPFVDLHAPAVLRAIQYTVDAAKRHNIPVGISGEMGADLTLTETFLRMGVDSFTVTPYALLPLRQIIRETDLSQPAGQIPVYRPADAMYHTSRK